MTGRILVMLAIAAAACGGETNPSVGSAPANVDEILVNGMTARQLVDARALHFKDLGGSFKSVRDQLRADRPNLTLVELSVKEVAYAAAELPRWFPVGTGPETGLEMRAFAEIWTDADGFAAAAERFRAAAAQLQSAAEASDLDALKARARLVGQACGGCHDTYRAEED